MKPNFALSLSFEGIALLHRAGRAGWHLVGDVSLSSRDLAGDMAALRAKAATLDPSGLVTKLIIPDDQIKYLDLPASGATGHDYDSSAREALEGATPYHVDDLAYDWSAARGRLYVAAVAAETLDEAESFALEHDFNPVSFVARPEPGRFAGEPFFGPAAQARDVDRDEAPVHILGRAQMPDDPQASADAPGAPSVSGPVAAPTPSPETAPEDPAAEAAQALTFSSIRTARAASMSAAPGLDAASRLAPVLAPAEDGRNAPPVPPVPSTAGPPPMPARPAGVWSARAPDPGAVPAARSIDTSADEAQRMTIFGARDPAAMRRKPRFLGLVLTVILLVFLVGVAAFATVFSGDGFAGLFRDPEPQVATVPDIGPEAFVAPAIPEPEIPAPAPAPRADPAPAAAPPELDQTPAPQPEPRLDPETVPDTGPEPAPEIAAPLPRPTDDPDDATARPAQERSLSRYAATGIWHLPPEPPEVPETDGFDGFYLTSIDEMLDFRDAVAIPAVPDTRSDTRPDTPPSPAPAETRFDLDSRGLVVATPDGALTPDRVIVRAGPPPVRPPETPPRAVPLPGIEQDAQSAAELIRLGGIRPRSRPEDLIEQQERGALAGRTRSELAALRPRPRPETVRQAAQSAAQSSAAADAAVDAASLARTLVQPGADDSPDAIRDALPQAVASSAKPRLRPGAVEQAARQQQSAAAAPAARTVAAERVAPRIPSTVSVARQATERNAINLRNINLIGVYGNPQNRRALVRLSNGRYEKVQVGDRLDGGRVSAIGDTELRYNKRGRDVVLRLPKG